MQNCLYTGTIRHRRFYPKAHEFQYRLFMLCLNLEELDKIFAKLHFGSLNRFNFLSFYRKDHYGNPEIPLYQSIRSLAETQLGKKVSGPIFLVTHLRLLGYVFNPVSFYYCYEADRKNLRAIVAEVHNTPWNEEYCYVLDPNSQNNTENYLFNLEKNFHVSPFMPMNLHYHWKFSNPHSGSQDKLFVQMENYEKGKLLFDATLNLQAQILSSKNLARVLLKFPFMSLKVIATIHYQALKLWLKGVPVFDHPKKAKEVVL